MNTWVGIGRLTKDTEVKYTKSGKAICRFTMAVDDGWGDNKRTYFIHVICWEKLAEACGNSLEKGQKVAVTGKITQRTYEQDGTKKSIVEILAREIDFGEKARGAQAMGVFPGRAIADDEIPF